MFTVAFLIICLSEWELCMFVSTFKLPLNAEPHKTFDLQAVCIFYLSMQEIHSDRNSKVKFEV